MTRPPRSVHLDELDAIPGPGTLTWHPVRAHLGIRAFGCNAYSAHRVGDDVIEPHVESPQFNHEELYFVARGRATFRIDDEEIDAPAGAQYRTLHGGTALIRASSAGKLTVVVPAFGSVVLQGTAPLPAPAAKPALTTEEDKTLYALGQLIGNPA